MIILPGTGSFSQPPGFEDPFPIRLIDSVECTPVKDQGQSPTCWVFGTNSVIESDVIKKSNTRLNLSEMFIARYAYIDKAAQFLATEGHTYFAGGGQFHDVFRVAARYGMVPEEVYPGLPNETYRHDHTRLDSSMQQFVRELLESGKSKLGEEDLQQLNDTLDKYLGPVPARFRWQGKEYTPVSFAKEVIRFGDDYLELVSFADKPLYRKFVLTDKYNWALDSFWNISLSDMQMILDSSLHRGWSVGWEGDVTGAGFNYFSGFAALKDTVTGSTDEQRLENYRTGNTERDHMLQVTAVGYDANGKKWYRLKNSWGTWLNRYQGYLYMEENYFRMKTVILLVNRNGLPVNLKEKLGLN